MASMARLIFSNPPNCRFLPIGAAAWFAYSSAAAAQKPIFGPVPRLNPF
jgi:hypothetical protein